MEQHIKTFNTTPEMKDEAKKRYPLPKSSFVVGVIGLFVQRKGQIVLLKSSRTSC